MRRFWIITGTVAAFVMIKFVTQPYAPTDSGTAFRKAVCSPKPASVRNIRYASERYLVQNDSVRIRYYLSFSVMSNDLQKILGAKVFQASQRDWSFSDSGDSDWIGLKKWFRVESIGTNAPFFRYDRGKRTDRLWVDGTGTNCFYLYEMVKWSPFAYYRL